MSLDPSKTLALKDYVRLMAICALPLSIVLITPLQIDNLIYQSLAFDLLRFHRIPYIGTWHHGLSGILLFHIPGVAAFGLSDVAFRVVDIVLQLAFITLLFRFLRHWLPKTTAALACVLYILFYVSFGGSVYGQRDIYSTMLVIASLHFLIVRSHTISNLVLAGIFAGIAVWVQVTSIVLVGLIVLFLMRSKRTWWLFAFLSAAPAVLSVLMYVFIPNGLQMFYYSVVRFNLDVYGKIHNSPKAIYDVLKSKMPIILLAALPLLRSKAARERRLTSTERALYISMLAASVAIIVIQSKYLPYHFVPFFMLLIPASACGVMGMCSLARRQSMKGVSIIAGCFLCSLGGYHPEYLVTFVKSGLIGSNPFRAIYAASHTFPQFGATEEDSLTRYLERPENRSASLELFSYSPELRGHLDREFIGPYIMPTALALPVRTEHGVPVYTDYQRKWQNAYMDTLSTKRPDLLIFARHTIFWDLQDPYQSWLRFMPGFDSFLNDNYHKDVNYGWYEVWRRNP